MTSTLVHRSAEPDTLTSSGPLAATVDAGAMDAAAFADLLDRHRVAALAHCRRILRSAADADDAVQETLLRAWRRRATFSGRSSFGWWLRAIATNACIDQIRRRQRMGELVRPFEDDDVAQRGAAGDQITDLAAVVAEREAVEHAYLHALRNLPDRQCAVLVLREVLRLPAAETAVLMDCTVAAVNSALQRAHAALAAARPRADRAERTRPATPAERDLVRRLVAAHERADAGAVVAALRLTA